MPLCCSVNLFKIVIYNDVRFLQSFCTIMIITGFTVAELLLSLSILLFWHCMIRHLFSLYKFAMVVLIEHKEWADGCWCRVWILCNTGPVWKRCTVFCYGPFLFSFFFLCRVNEMRQEAIFGQRDLSLTIGFDNYKHLHKGLLTDWLLRSAQCVVRVFVCCFSFF